MTTVLSILATYGATLIITEYDGPAGIFYRLRSLKFLSALKCFGCTSIWVSMLVSLPLSDSIYSFLTMTLAFSGSAILLHEVQDSLRGRR